MYLHINISSIDFIRSLRRGLLWLIFIAFSVFGLSGCGDFFESKPTELESRAILSEIGNVKVVPLPQTEVYDVYKEPAKIIEGKVGDKTDAKLFYFTKYHKAEGLRALVHEQFIKQFFITLTTAYKKLRTPKQRRYVVLNTPPDQRLYCYYTTRRVEGNKEFFNKVGMDRNVKLWFA